MSDYKLQVCKPFENGDWKGIYRFMVINPNDHRGYPANYVCYHKKSLIKANH